jgi:hypothetical protein
MKGFIHEVWEHQDGVGMSNCSDDYYAVIFESREELEAFVAKLIAAADCKWSR